MWLRLNRTPKKVLCFEKINWVTNRVYHENRPHSSSKFESFLGSQLVSKASKYSSVILTLKVYFISPHKLLFGCIFGPRLNSLAICPVLRNIDGYAFTHSTPWHSAESLPRRPFATKIDKLKDTLWIRWAYSISFFIYLKWRRLLRKKFSTIWLTRCNCGQYDRKSFHSRTLLRMSSFLPPSHHHFLGISLNWVVLK